MGMVTILYVLVNIAYVRRRLKKWNSNTNYNRHQFAGVSRDEFLASDLTIAASLFKNVFGQSAAVKALPALVALSAIGHLLSVAFTVCTHSISPALLFRNRWLTPEQPGSFKN